MLGIVGALLLAPTSFAPAGAEEAPQKKAADVEFTIVREGQDATTFELSDCQVHVNGSPGSTATINTDTHVYTLKGDATISAFRDGKQVFFMSVKNAVITQKSNAGG